MEKGLIMWGHLGAVTTAPNDSRVANIYMGVENPSINIKHYSDPPGCSSLNRDQEKQMFIASLLSFVDCKIA